jgi:hypothetical protein
MVYKGRMEDMSVCSYGDLADHDIIAAYVYEHYV